MRRMIPTKFVEWIKSLFEKVQQNGNTTEVGGNLEVDGNVVVNGAENIVDKEGHSIIPSGGTKLYKHKITLTKDGETDLEHIIFVSTDSTPLAKAEEDVWFSTTPNVVVHITDINALYDGKEDLEWFNIDYRLQLKMGLYQNEDGSSSLFAGEIDLSNYTIVDNVSEI